MSGENKSLRQRVISGSSVTLLGYGAGQMLRLISNLVLARLLFPEAFGLMALLQSILIGAVLLTDIGLSMSIVRSPRGTSPQFLNTVWTLQILKGLLISTVLLVVAQPTAAIYGNSELAQMIAFTGLIAILQGCRSTKLDLAQRNMRFKRIVIIDLSTQIFQFVLTVLLAWILESVWALVIGNAAQAAAHTILTHLTLEGPRNRLAWSKDVVSEVFGFGAWIMVTSTLTYFAGEGLTLLRASFMPLDVLGQFSIAASLTMMGWTAIQKLSGQVFFAAYAETMRDDPSRLPSRVRTSRRFQLTLGWLTCAVLVFFGELIVGILYDDRYALSGRILETTSTILVVSLLSSTYGGLPEALGKPKISALLLALQGAFAAAGIFVGGYFFGIWGVILSGAFVAIALYPIATYTYSSLGFKDLLFDTLGFLLFLCLASFVYWRSY